MSVYRSKGRKTFVYDFWYAGRHYKGNTHQITEADARTVEGKLRLKLRRARGGIGEPDAVLSFSAWADAYYRHLGAQRRRTGRPKRIEKIDELLRVVLRFWGQRPEDPTSPVQPQPGEEAPFHNLTLQDPIDQPEWILEWEAWMDRRNIAGGTRNHYNTTLSRMYAVATLAEYRRQSGVRENPFAGRPRSPKAQRTVALAPDAVLRWIGAMSYHTRLAVAIAALAPALRLQNVLKLERGRDIDPATTVITIWDHKTDFRGKPIVQPISDQLRTILLDAFSRMAPKTVHVVQYRGKAVSDIRAGLAAAAREAGITYGRFAQNGATFHTLRHTAATLLASLGVTPWLQAETLQQADVRTTVGYTHLRAEQQRPALERLSAELPIAAAVTAPTRRATRTKAGGLLRGDEDAARQNRPDSARLTRGALVVAGRRFGQKRPENA